MDPRVAHNRRIRWGVATAAIGLAVASFGLLPARESISLAGIVLLFLLPVVATAAVGGVWLGLAAALAADVLVNFLFVPPYHTLSVDGRDNVITLIVYVVVAAAVAIAVDVAARDRATAARRAIEARLLAQAAQSPVAETSLARLLTEVRDSYRMQTVALTEHDTVIERVGPPAEGPPTLSARSGGGMRLVAWGPPVFAEDRGALARLAAAAARTHENQRQAARAGQVEEADRLRAALLSAVGHDLRTPLAGIKAAVSSLRQPEVVWSAQDEAELLATVEESTDRLVGLVENLLSLSRLQAGALSVYARPVPLDAVVAQALLGCAGGGDGPVEVDVPDDLPLVRADPGLLERVVANLVANARTASPAGSPVLVRGAVDGDVLVVQIVDRGPGIPPADRERMFAPFQRLGDHGTDGLGLGLAIAKGFTEAMGGAIDAADTPGGGLTMTLRIPMSISGAG
jgi:K+-sensing histidine kinase KdpD